MKKKRMSKLLGGTMMTIALMSSVGVESYAMESMPEQTTIEQNTNNELKTPGFSTQRILQETKRVNGVSTGYATSTWIKASSYTSGNTYSTSASYNFNGVTSTIGFSKTISATIPANPAKYSRLKGKADITFKKYKVLHYQGGSIYKTTYEVDKIYHNTYLDVVYK